MFKKLQVSRGLGFVRETIGCNSFITPSQNHATNRTAFEGVLHDKSKVRKLGKIPSTYEGDPPII